MIAVVLASGWLKEETARRHLEDLSEELLYVRTYDEMLPHKDAIDIIFGTGKPDPDVIAQLPNLKWVFSWSAGVDMYPMALLRDKGIQLTNTSGVHKTNIAEQVLGGMIMFSRNLITAVAQQREKKWKNFRLDELTGKQLLVIGTGQIGTEIARKAKAFDMTVHGVRFRDGQPKPEHFDEVVSVDHLMEVLPGKDYVVLVVPATAQTIGMMGAAQFAAMDDSAIFISVGRGNTVKEAELVAALQAGQIRGAMLDVFEVEPLPEASPLWDMPNVIITPHTAGPTPHYAARSFALFRDNLQRFRADEPLHNLIDLNRTY